MASLYEQTDGMRLLFSLIDEGVLDEEALREALEVAKEDLALKLEDYCKVIKCIESDIEGIRAEEKRLAERRRVYENNIQRMKKAMTDALNVAKVEKSLKCGSFSVSVQKNPPKVVMDEQYIENIPDEYLVTKEPEVNKSKILEDLKSGKVLDGIAHLERTEGVRIR